MREIGKLTQLRVLRIRVYLDAKLSRSLVDFIGKLQNIQVLQVIQSEPFAWFDEAKWEGLVPPRQLLKLHLSFRFSRLPAWINSSLLPNLRHLHIVDDSGCSAPRDPCIGMLPELLSLTLWSPPFKSSIEVMGDGTFPKLRYFYEHTHVIHRFLQGAMPILQSIMLVVKVSDNNFDFGSLRNLTCLEEITVEMDCWGARRAELLEGERQH